ncbi:MAG: hypothetical protein LBU73_00065 [Helicobacteraceae bacterium]|jgi:hypothetical protein|nr:hypothetical protein [Helicobacteraceae bacterium]
MTDFNAFLKNEDKEFFERFLNREFFEREVFGAPTREGLERNLLHVFDSILIDPRYGKFLNFTLMKSYDHLNISKIAEALRERLARTIKIAIGKYYTEDAQVDEIMRSSYVTLFITSLAADYLSNFRESFLRAIGDTFTNAAATFAESELPIAAREAFTGTRTRQSILTFSGHIVATKPDQIKLRVSQAQIAKERKIEAAKKALEKDKRAFEGLKKNIKAIAIARSQTAQILGSFSAERVREIVVNEDGKETDAKRILQYLPSGEEVLTLLDRQKRAFSLAATDLAREEHTRAIKYLMHIYGNNSAAALAEKERKTKDDLPRMEAHIAREDAALEAMREKRLENFDDGLARIYEVILYNLAS